MSDTQSADRKQAPSAGRPISEREPLDFERHQVVRLYGAKSTQWLREMQEFCDQYGLEQPVTDAVP